MKINGYFVNVVCANYDKEIRGYGDIYEEVEECLEHHPDDEVIFGFHLKKEGLVFFFRKHVNDGQRQHTCCHR